MLTVGEGKQVVPVLYFLAKRQTTIYVCIM